MQTAAERLRQLQQQSQFYDPMRGPLLAGPGVRQDDPAELRFPEQPQPARPTPAEVQASIADIKDRPLREASANRSAELARRGGEAAATQKKNEAAVASSILPGEEQVTSQDTFRSLSQPEQAALRGKYDSGGHSGTMTFEDWLSENYAELPPEERAAQMRSQGAAVPTRQVGRDPNLQPGENSALAKKRRAAGLALPEGREASQYDPRQAEFMQRNLHNPDIPMTRFGGTNTLAPGARVGVGGGYARAPDPALYDRDPSTPDLVQQTVEAHGEDSPSALIARAQAFGIDVAQYGDDLDMLRVDVERMQQEHDRRFASADVVKNPAGGYRYKFNPDKSAQMIADRDASMSPARKAQFANEIGQRFAGLMTDEEAARLESLIHTPDGFAQLRAMNQSLDRRRDALAARNVRNNYLNTSMTRAYRDPQRAQGLYMRSLQAAAQSGDPFQVAAVHSAFGNDRAARDYMSLAGQDAQAAAAMVAAEAGAQQDAPEAPEAWADKFAAEMNKILSTPDAAMRRTMLVEFLRKVGMPEEQIEKRADELIASAGGAPITPQQGLTLWQRLFGGGQSPATQQQAATPTPSVPTQPPASPAAPPASGRGGALNDFMRGLPMFSLPQQVSPYGNRPRSVV